jgi:predicted dehydrogenase
MAEKIRWGIIGTGNIARQFARGLAVVPDAELVAVGSRTQASADAFAELFSVPHRHATYEALAEDPQVDVVYVATPHNLHCANSLLCLEAGKAVLCEKPFTINAAEAAQVIDRAREKGLFLMEAMWTRFLPALVRLRELLTTGTIGPVHLLAADLGFRAQFDPKSRLFDSQLGGGALLDLGVYPVSLASMVFGAPACLTGLAYLGATGVDEQAGVVLGYDAGRLAVIYMSIRAETSREAILMGSSGQIRVHAPIFMPAGPTLSLVDQTDQVLDLPFTGNGYNYEAVEVMDCMRAGQTECAVMPLDETLSIMQTMDQIRAQWGLKYPMEIA